MEDVEASALKVQANSDSQGTLKLYCSYMNQLSRYLDRTVFSMGLFEHGDPRQEGIHPVEMSELLNFLEAKRQRSIAAT